MAFSFLDTKNLAKTYTESKTFTNSLTEPFTEFERIARNRPHPKIDANLPKTTDGTTASVIRKTPRRVVQQLPTGKVKSDQSDWLTVVADFIYIHKIIPYANEQYSLIQKCWQVIEKALTFGFCPTYTPFLERNGNFIPDLTIPYWGDVFIQPGKHSDADSNYIFMRSWWRKEDIQALIDKQSKLSKDVKSSWDVENLTKILDSPAQKDNRAQSPVERERGVNTKGGIELVTGFQRGVKAKFYTFHPATNLIVRTKTNKDPRGELPIQFMYGDIDGTNPLGRGIVELVGGLQNLMDSEMQMYQFNRALGLNPPLLKKGNYPKSQIQFLPNKIIDLGSDKDASLEALSIDTTAIANFPNNYGLMKSQMLGLLSSPESTISADIGNPAQSKTTAGVNQANTNVSVDDNYVRKMFEVWFEKWSETAINLYFAERAGVEPLQLDKQTAQKLRELPGFDQTLLNDQDQIMVNYDDPTEALTFRVDPSTTSLKTSSEQVQDATNLLDLVMKYPMLNASYGGPIDTDVLARRIVVNSSIDDPEQVAPEPTEAQKQSKEEQKNQVSPFSPMFDKPSIRINYPDLPPAAQVQLLANAGVQVTEQDVLQGPVLDPNMRGTINPVDDPNILVPGGGQAQQPAPAQDSNQANPQQGAQPQFAPEDQHVIQQLQQAGIPDQKIGQALAMLHSGKYNEYDIMTMLGGQ